MKIDKTTDKIVEALVSGTTIFDTSGAEALTFILPVVDTVSVALVDGDEDDLADAAAVDASYIIGATAFTATGTGVIGYVGKKRYVKATITNGVADSTPFAIKESLRRSVNH